MRVVAFAPSLSAVEEESGGVNIKGFPMTACYIDSFPAQITIPMVVSVCALGGGEYDPVRVIAAYSAASSAATLRVVAMPRLLSGA